LDRGQSDVGGEREIDALALERQCLGLCFQRLDLPARAPPYVERVGDGDLCRVQGEDRSIRGRRRSYRGQRLPLSCRIPVGRHLREQRAALGKRARLGHPHGGFGRLQVGVVGNPQLDEVVEMARPEDLPPARRYIAARNVNPAGRSLVRRKISGDRRQLRRREVGSERATRQHGSNQQSLEQQARTAEHTSSPMKRRRAADVAGSQRHRVRLWIGMPALFSATLSCLRGPFGAGVRFQSCAR
jgi:hypothetical protein